MTTSNQPKEEQLPMMCGIDGYTSKDIELMQEHMKDVHKVLDVDPNCTQCITCMHNLHYKPIEDWYGNTSLDLAYCPNEKCLRYGLLTLEADELLSDKVAGYTEKVEPTNEGNSND